jgi:hypothetical protein
VCGYLLGVHVGGAFTFSHGIVRLRECMRRVNKSSLRLGLGSQLYMSASTIAWLEGT